MRVQPKQPARKKTRSLMFPILNLVDLIQLVEPPSNEVRRGVTTDSFLSNSRYVAIDVAPKWAEVA